MALSLGIELDEAATLKDMKDSAENSNIGEMVEHYFKEAELQLLPPQVISSRLKANFIAENKHGKKHIIEIVEEDMAHYAKAEEGAQMVEMRRRGRLADQLAKEAGYAGYSCISYIELEYAIDERELL